MYSHYIRTNHPELTALHFSETIQTSSAKRRYIMLLSCNMKVQKLLFLLSLWIYIMTKVWIAILAKCLVYTWLTYRNTTLHAYMIKTKRDVYITGETNIHSRKTAFILFILNALYSSYQSCHALSKWINVSTMLFKYLTKLNSNWVIWLFFFLSSKI